MLAFTEKEIKTVSNIENSYKPRNNEERARENDGMPKWVFNAEKRLITLRCMDREEYETTAEYLKQLIKVRKGLQDRVIYPGEKY